MKKKYYLCHTEFLSIQQHILCRIDQSRDYRKHRLYNVLRIADYSLYRTIYLYILLHRKKCYTFFKFIPFLSQGKHYYKNTLNANSILYNQTCTLSSYLYYNISQSTQVYTQNIIHSVCDMCCLYSLSGIKVHNCCRRDWYFYIL